jgi:hypothetical protein
MDGKNARARTAQRIIVDVDVKCVLLPLSQ